MFVSGRWTVFTSTCGLTVWWNGHSAIVHVPTSYRNQLHGICGNCNGLDTDDYTTRDGKDVSVLPQSRRDIRITESYIPHAIKMSRRFVLFLSWIAPNNMNTRVFFFHVKTYIVALYARRNGLSSVGPSVRLTAFILIEIGSRVLNIL